MWNKACVTQKINVYGYKCCCNNLQIPRLQANKITTVSPFCYKDEH